MQSTTLHGGLLLVRVLQLQMLMVEYGCAPKGERG